MSRVKTIPGQTRTCPICRATILESASVCPGCRHHLRYVKDEERRGWTSFTPLGIEGTLRHTEGGEPWEYSVVLTIRDDKGEELARQVVGVGALKPAEERTFEVAVEVLRPVVEEAAETH